MGVSAMFQFYEKDIRTTTVPIVRSHYTDMKEVKNNVTFLPVFVAQAGVNAKTYQFLKKFTVNLPVFK